LSDTDFRLPGLPAGDPPDEVISGAAARATGNGADDIPDFVVKRPPSIKFKIDGELFEAVPAIGATVTNEVLDEEMDVRLAMVNLEKYVDEQGEVIEGAATDDELTDVARKIREHVGKMMTFLDEVLVEESRQRFAARLRSKTNPIDLTQVRQAHQYLVERYANRPSMPSSVSTNGHGTTGPSSTAGALPAE
jgi:hypothetical protein